MPNLETRTQKATNNTLPTGPSGTNQGPVRPLVDAGKGSIAQAQSRQQVGHPTPAGMLNNRVQGSVGGPASSFSSFNSVPQPPLANASSIAQVQSRQQGVQPTPSGMLNNGIQGSAGSSASSFSSINHGHQGRVRPLVDSSGPDDLVPQVGQAGGIDQADIVWSKMQMLKEKYLQDMKDLHSMLTARSQQYMPQEQRQKLMHYKLVLQRMIPYLIAPKGSLPKEFKQEKVEAFEKQIVSIMETFKRHKQPQQLQGNLGPPPAGQQPQHATQILQLDNKPLQQQQQALQTNSAPTELESNNTSNSSFPFLQSNVVSLQQAMGVAAQPTPPNSLSNTAANALHQGASGDLLQQVGQAGGINQADIVWSKAKTGLWDKSCVQVIFCHTKHGTHWANGSGVASTCATRGHGQSMGIDCSYIRYLGKLSELPSFWYLQQCTNRVIKQRDFGMRLRIRLHD